MLRVRFAPFLLHPSDQIKPTMHIQHQIQIQIQIQVCIQIQMQIQIKVKIQIQIKIPIQRQDFHPFFCTPVTRLKVAMHIHVPPVLYYCICICNAFLYFFYSCYTFLCATVTRLNALCIFKSHYHTTPYPFRNTHM